MHNQKNKRRKRVLLVDDEHDICMTFQTVLEDAGFECNYYTDSVKALQEFRPNYYDLVLLDVKMPVLNGFELCKKMRELDKSIQLIFTTAGGEYREEIGRQSYRESNNKFIYIQKPIGNEELAQIVKFHISNN
ncbi:MAG: response regulator [Nitrososphaeraceae archaeon]|jgi:DNA-binding response OmpR family regulator